MSARSLSLAIVLGGVTACIFICYPLKDVARVLRLFFVALKREELPIGNYIHEIQFLARQAASKGTLRLEGELNTIENYFLQDGLQMLVDQRSPEEVKQTRFHIVVERQEISRCGGVYG